MTAEKANLAKKIPSSPKKILFATFQIPLADGASCVTFSATRESPHPPPSPSWQKSHLLDPYRCVKFEREKKLYFFFVEEIVFLLAFGLSAKLMPKAMELLFPHPPHTTLLNFSSKGHCHADTLSYCHAKRTKNPKKCQNYT
jgi:hypothetical protein